MRSLAAAISPGLFGFTDWAFAAAAPSEIAMQVPRATRKNNALIIISSHISFILAHALNLFQPHQSSLPRVRGSPQPTVGTRSQRQGDP
jgi:hypothetical protein